MANGNRGGGRVRGQRAQAVLEFALLAPFIFGFLFAIVDLGLAINHRVVVTNAAREGARMGATGASPTQIADWVVQQSEGLVTDPSKVTVQFFDVNGNPGLQPGDAVAVQVQYSYKLFSPIGGLFPALSSLSIPMNACADMRLEQVWLGAVATTGQSPCQ